MDVYFYEAFTEEAEALEAILPPSIRAGYTPKTIQESGDSLPRAPLLSVRTQSIIPGSWSRKITGIMTRTTGYDHVLAYLKTCGVAIPTGYLPRYCPRAVAEQAVLLFMALLRKLPMQIDHFNRFDRNGLTGGECEGKTLVVVGVGNIGYEIVRLGLGLGMEVIGVDIVEKHKTVRYLPIREAVPRAHVLVCSMNLTDQNRGYFNEKLFESCKPGALFVNVARGEMSPSSHLLRSLEAGRLGGVGLDVFDHEAILAESLRTGKTVDDSEAAAALALARHPLAILTPHNAFNTQESVDRKASHTVEQVVGFIRDKRFQWPVPENR